MLKIYVLSIYPKESNILKCLFVARMDLLIMYKQIVCKCLVFPAYYYILNIII